MWHRVQTRLKVDGIFTVVTDVLKLTLLHWLHTFMRSVKTILTSNIFLSLFVVLVFVTEHAKKLLCLAVAYTCVAHYDLW